MCNMLPLTPTILGERAARRASALTANEPCGGFARSLARSIVVRTSSCSVVTAADSWLSSTLKKGARSIVRSFVDCLPPWLLPITD